MTDADTALAELEERVRSGDESVTPEDVEQARGFARFAVLRREAQERRAAQARQEQADADARQARDAFLAEIPDDPAARVTELREQATAALVALETYVRDYNRVIGRHIDGLRVAGRDSRLDITASHPGDSALSRYVSIDGRVYQVMREGADAEQAANDARQMAFQADAAGS